MHKLYFTFLLSLILFCSGSVLAQNDSLLKRKAFSISINFVQLCINEANIGIERKINERISLGVNIGSLYYNRAFAVVFWSPSQDRWPGTVYDGFSIRGQIKYYRKKFPGKYWSAQVVYKNMYYSNHVFTDDYHYYYTVYTRSEDAILWGIDIIRGREFESTKKKSLKDLMYGNPKFLKDKFFSDVFFGIGFRRRGRDYTTLDNNDPYRNIPPLGSYHINQWYPVLIFGVKIGMNVFKH